MQPDRGLVQHVENADQAGPDLGGQADPLGLAAGQRAGGAIQRQVVEADVKQEPQPGPDLLDDPLGDLPLAVGEVDRAQELGALVDRQGTDLRDVLPTHPDGEHFRLEPGTAAYRAGHFTHVALVAVPAPLGVGLGVATLDERHDPFETGGVGPVAAVAVAIRDVDLVVLPEEQGLLGPFGERPPGGVERELQVVGHRLDDAHEVVGRAGAAPPRSHRALRDREVLVGDAQLGVDLELGAQTGAGRAGAEGRVEREGPGLDLVDGQGVVVGAGHPLGEAPLLVGLALLAVHEVDEEYAARQHEGGLHRVGEPSLGRRVVTLGDQPVDDHLDGVLDLLLELGRVGQRDDLTVDPGPGEALGLQLGEQVDELALTGLDDRREDLEAGALRELEQSVDDLLGALAGDRLVADGAVRATDPGEQQTEVVVDLGDRPHRRAWVAVGRLLVDRHGRGEALNEVDVGLVHLAEELAGIGRQGLDVTTLPLGEDRVERQRRLPRAGQAREDDEAVAGQLDRDVLEVVLAGPPNDQGVAAVSARLSFRHEMRDSSPAGRRRVRLGGRRCGRLGGRHRRRCGGSRGGSGAFPGGRRGHD